MRSRVVNDPEGDFANEVRDAYNRRAKRARGQAHTHAVDLSGYRKIFADAETNAQHGPVRILVKDGKPVNAEPPC